MKKISYLVTLLLVLAVLSGCGNGVKEEKSNADKGKKITVTASIYPVADFAKIVGGEYIDLQLLVPKGVEAHDWEPTAKDIKTIQSSDIFLYNGGGIEPWLEKILPELLKKNIVVVETGKNLFVEHEEHEHASDHKHDHSDGHSHNHDGLDPHIWLNPLLAIKQVESIRDAFVQIDPNNKEHYEKNAAKFIAELQKLHEEYTALSEKTKGQEFVTMHTAFAYLALEYDWQQLALMGIDPHAEPTPAELAQVIKEVEQKGIKYVFVEPQKDDRLMQEVAKQTKTKVLFLDPLENPLDDNKGYLDGMKSNLENLRKAFLQEE